MIKVNPITIQKSGGIIVNPVGTKPQPTKLDTQFQERQTQSNIESLAKFGIDADKAQEIKGVTPMKTFPEGVFSGEARAESYYGKEGIQTPRSSSYDYEALAEKDGIKRTNMFGILKTELDHLDPKALGGTESEENLKTVKAKTGFLGLKNLFKKTTDLPPSERQGGGVELEQKIIDAYQKGEITQVEGLFLIKEFKDKRDGKVNVNKEAVKMATNKIKDTAKSIWNYFKTSSKSSIEQFEEEQGIKATPLSILYGVDIQDVDGKPQVVKVKEDYKLPVQQMAENIVTAPLRIGASVHEGVTGKETSFKIPKLDEIMTYQKQYKQQVEAGMPEGLSGLATGVNALFDVMITYSMIRPMLNRPGKSVIEYDEAVTKGSKMTKDNAREILGVNKNSTLREIKSARNRLVQKYHPDKTINWNISQGEKDVLRTKFDNVMKAYSKLTKIKAEPVVINTSTAEAMKQDIMTQASNLTPKPKTTIKVPTQNVVSSAIGKEAVSSVAKPTIKISGVKPVEPTITTGDKTSYEGLEDSKIKINPVKDTINRVQGGILEITGKDSYIPISELNLTNKQALELSNEVKNIPDTTKDVVHVSGLNLAKGKTKLSLEELKKLSPDVQRTLDNIGYKPVEASQKPKTADTEVLDKKMTTDTSLIEQARNAKSVEEFVGKQPTADMEIINKDGDLAEIDRIDVADSMQKKGAGTNTIGQYFEDNNDINKLVGIAEVDSVGFWKKIGANMESEIPRNYNQKLVDEGDASPVYIGFELNRNDFFNKSKYKTKSQLEQIYKEANKKPVKKTKELTYKPVEEVKKVSPTIKETKVGKSIETKAIDKGILSGLEEVAEYNATTIKEQTNIFDKFIQETSKEEVLQVIRGNKELPEGLKGASALVGLENYAVKNGDGSMLLELAKSPLATETSEAGQTLRLIRERKRDSAAAQIYRLKRARDARAKRKLKDRGKSETKVKENIKKSAKKAVAKEKITKSEWDNFINEIKC